MDLKKAIKDMRQVEAVLNDMQTDINMPFALKWDGKELDLIAKTVMRKPNFATSKTYILTSLPIMNG